MYWFFKCSDWERRRGRWSGLGKGFLVNRDRACRFSGIRSWGGVGWGVRVGGGVFL